MKGKPKCPLCHNQNLRVYEDKGLVFKICCSCGLEGPWSGTEEEAYQAFRRITIKQPEATPRCSVGDVIRFKTGKNTFLIGKIKEAEVSLGTVFYTVRADGLHEVLEEAIDSVFATKEWPR